MSTEKIMNALLVLLIVLTLCTSVAGIKQAFVQYEYQKDISRLYKRCVEAGDAEILSNCLTNLTDNMEAIGMTQGYDVRFFPGPNNDMARDYANLHVIQDRAESLTEKDTNSFEYITGMSELREQLYELRINAKVWVRLHLLPFHSFVSMWGWWGLVGLWVIWALAAWVLEY
jgi:hypothetical protein